MLKKYKLLILLVLIPYIGRSELKTISYDIFIKRALQNDEKFQQILLDQLAIKLNKDLKLTPEALITSVKSQYGTALGESDKGLNTTVSLEKLFRNTGTKLSASYSNVNYSSSSSTQDSLSLSISQDIAKNAFGKLSQKEAAIVGIENQIIEHQLIEAYEDYLATLTMKYLEWYLAYQNKITSEAFLTNAEEQEKNMKARRAKNIANRIEVNKMTLQTLSRKETLLASNSLCKATQARIKDIMHDTSDTEYTPQNSFKYSNLGINFKTDFNTFINSSRTFKILKLLEKNKSKQLSYDIDNLLPSAQILLDYSVSGKSGIFKDDDKKSIFAGIKLSYPFGDAQKKATIKKAQIELKKAKLTIKGQESSLRSNIFELYTQINELKAKKEIIKQKIAVAEKIYKEEQKYYRQGRSKINDLISALNDLENYRFSLLSTEISLNKLIIEWLRVTDTLVKKP